MRIGAFPSSGDVREIHPTNWLRYAGLATWSLVALTLLLLPLIAREKPLPPSHIFGWWASSVLFILAFLHPAARLRDLSPLWQRILVLVIMRLM